MNAPVDAYAAKPWLRLYPVAQPASLNREYGDMLSLYRATLRDPDGVAAWYFDGAMTRRQLEAHGAALAVWLAEAGVGKGDRVSLILQNVPGFLIAMVAAWKLGAVPVPSNPMYRRDELAKLFADSTPTVVICHDDHFATVCEGLQKAEQTAAVLVTTARDFQISGAAPVLPAARQSPSGAQGLTEVLQSHAGRAPTELSLRPDELGLLLYTSGTTGQPKGAMLSHANLAFNSQTIRDWCGLTGASRILAVAPLFHITGIICHIGAALSAGCPMILHYRFDPAMVVEIIRDRRPTFTIAAITAFNALMNAPGVSTDDFTSFDAVYSGGAPIAPVLVDAIRSKLGVTIIPAFGMTETTSPTHIGLAGVASPIDPDTGALAIGIPVFDTEAMIVDDDGRPAPVGQSGEVWMRGPQIMGGYLNKPDQTAEALVDGWMRSGDVGFMDEAGWFYLIDRKKDMISASGFKVWPREVEDVLIAHPAVREAAVVGEPDPYRGETVKAFISFMPGATVGLDDIHAHCRERLASYKCPRRIEVLAEIPKTLTGKIQRAALREP